MSEELDVDMGVDTNELKYYGAQFVLYLGAQRFPYVDAYVAWDEAKKVRFAIENEYVEDAKVMELLRSALEVIARDMSDEGFIGGPDVRSKNVIARLVFIGALPKKALLGAPTFADFMDWQQRITAAVHDISQLDRDMIKEFQTAGTAFEALAGLERAVVEASFDTLASRKKIVLSANYWREMFNLRGSKLEGNLWHAPKGDVFEMVMCPVTHAPLYVKDAVQFQDYLRRITGCMVEVVPGSLVLMELVATTLLTYKCKWHTEKGLIMDTQRVVVGYKGFFSGVRWTNFLAMAGMLPEWSKALPPPTNLMGKRRMPDYLAYVFDWAMRNKTEIKVWPGDVTVRRWADNVVRASLVESMKGWLAVTTFKSYYAMVLDHKPVPVTSLADACDHLERRRSVENVSTAMTDLLGSSTANNRVCDDRAAINSTKFFVPIRWLASKLPVPSSIDICGDDTGILPLASAKWLAKDGVVNTYGCRGHLLNADWTPLDGYPDKSSVVFCDFYGDVSKDNDDRMKAKVTAIAGSNYQGGCIKFMFSSKSVMKGGEDGVQLPFGLTDFVKHYELVRCFSAGRAHSPELYICFAHRLAVPSFKTVNDVVVGMFSKAVLMTIANSFRTCVFSAAYATALTDVVGGMAGGYHRPGISGGVEWVSGSVYKEVCHYLGFGTVAVPEMYDISDFIAAGPMRKREEGLEYLPVLADMDHLSAEIEGAITDVIHADKPTIKHRARKRQSMEVTPSTPPISYEEVGEEEEEDDDTMGVPRKPLENIPEKYKDETKHKKPKKK